MALSIGRSAPVLCSSVAGFRPRSPSLASGGIADTAEATHLTASRGAAGADGADRTSKYLNKIIEADHGALKQLIRPVGGFQSMRTTNATIRALRSCV
jgi:hypothetical protein